MSFLDFRDCQSKTLCPLLSYSCCYVYSCHRVTFYTPLAQPVQTKTQTLMQKSYRSGNRFVCRYLTFITRAPGVQLWNSGNTGSSPLSSPRLLGTTASATFIYRGALFIRDYTHSLQVTSLYGSKGLHTQCGGGDVSAARCPLAANSRVQSAKNCGVFANRRASG